MPQPPAQPQNLVLKRREDEQSDIRSFNLLRIPKSYSDSARSGLGQLCIIYVPTRGSPSMPSFEAHYVARAIIKGIVSDPQDASKLLLALEGVERFTAPVPFHIDGLMPETGERFGRRDHSLEQKNVRAISFNHLQRLLQLGSAPLSLSGNSDKFAIQPQNATPPNPGFNEEDLTYRQIKAAEPARSHATPIVRSRYVRLKSRLVDKGTCVVTGFHCEIDNRPVGISVAHIRSLKKDGDDWLTTHWS